MSERFWTFFPWIFAGSVVVLIIAVTYAVERDRRINGTEHCGQVETTTPAGERALEEKCWRSK